MAEFPHSALFISVEGIEASGKSTLVAGLAARFARAGIDAVVTREPGGTPLGDGVRALFLDPSVAIGPVAEAFLLNASRAQLVAETIRPALEAGRLVICDRYVDATLAYQGFGRGLKLEMLRSLCDAATGGLLPDRTLLVDLPTETAFARLEASGRIRDRMELEDARFHERVRQGYLTLARADARLLTLDGSLEQGALLDCAWDALAPLLALTR